MLNMEKCPGMLISSARTLERSASSEVYYVLTELLDYDNVKAEPLKDISGLSIATFKEDPIITVKTIKKLIEEDSSILRFTLKLVPFQYRVLTELENLENAAESLSKQINDTDTWKINLRRRHTILQREDIITSFASKITKGKVMLDNPIYYIVIEILGKWTYLALTSIPDLSMSKYRSDESEDDFTF